MTNTQKAIAIPLLALTVLGGGAMLGYAQLSNADTEDSPRMGMGMRGEGVHGEITAINGETITILGKDGETYTVDASDALVKKFTSSEGMEDINVDTLAVGDEIGVRGEVDDTSVVASHIMTGHPGKGMGMGGHRGDRGVMGEVTAIDGNTITVTSPDGESYTVDAGDAAVSRVAEGSLNDIAIGDRIGVHGEKDGTTVHAVRIMDDLPLPLGEQQ
jgi:riboflavin synthase alpha subunit